MAQTYEQVIANIPRAKKARIEREKARVEDIKRKNREYRAKIEPKLKEFKIFDMVNDMLALGLESNKKKVTVYQDELVRQIKKNVAGIGSEEDIIDNDLLEFQGFYEENGWKVEYQSPGYKHGDIRNRWIFIPPVKKGIKSMKE